MFLTVGVSGTSGLYFAFPGASKFKGRASEAGSELCFCVSSVSPQFLEVGEADRYCFMHGDVEAQRH